jgi:tetratricopeptide (TPR) repeat protein
MTCRPDFRPPWPDVNNVTIVTLGRLEPANVRTLIASLTGDAALPTSVVEQIAVNTDGVPLFVEELTRMVLESGLVIQEAERLELQGALSGIGIPATLQDSMMARLDRMAAVKHIAQIAAAIGREFSFKLLHQVSSLDPETLNTALVRLEEAGLLLQIIPPPNAHYRFKHSLLQNAAYETLLKSTRQVLHARIAAVLSEGSHIVNDTEPEVIAYHFNRAGQNRTAAEWWTRAGQRALERSAQVEAIAHFRNAIALADRLHKHPLPAASRLQLQIAYAQALIAVHSHAAPVTVAAFARARELLTQIKEPAERFAVYYGLWAGSNIRGELASAEETAAAFLADAKRQQPMPELGVAHRALGTTFWTKGALSQARGHLQRALEIHDPQRDRALCLRLGLDPGVGAMMQLAIVQWQLGEVAQAVALANQGLDAANKTTHVLTIAFAHGWLSVRATLRNDSPGALASAKTLVDLSAEHAMTLWQAMGTMFLGHALVQASADTSWLGSMREVIDSFHEERFRLYLTFFPSLLAQAETEAGNIDGAISLIEQALVESESSGQVWYVAELHRLRAGLALRKESEGLTFAEHHLRQALGMARAQEAKSFARRTAMLLAAVYERRGTKAEHLPELSLDTDGDTDRLERTLLDRTFGSGRMATVI